MKTNKVYFVNPCMVCKTAPAMFPVEKNVFKRLPKRICYDCYCNKLLRLEIERERKEKLAPIPTPPKTVQKDTSFEPDYFPYEDDVQESGD